GDHRRRGRDHRAGYPEPRAVGILSARPGAARGSESNDLDGDGSVDTRPVPELAAAIASPAQDGTILPHGAGVKPARRDLDCIDNTNDRGRLKSIGRRTVAELTHVVPAPARRR